MRKLSVILISILAILMAIGGASAELNFTDTHTAYRVSDFIASSNGSDSIGAIKISNIDIANAYYDGIITVAVIADTYNLTISAKRGIYVSFINFTFHDYITGTTESHEWWEFFPGTNDSIYIPWVYFGNIIFDSSIENDKIYWSKNDATRANLKPLLNNPINESQLSYRRVLPSKTVRVIVTQIHPSSDNTGKVDVTYLTGTPSDIGKVTTNWAGVSDFLNGTSSDPYSILRAVPVIGATLGDSTQFLIEFISLLFLLLFYIITNIDIVVITQLDFCMLHGIMRMASGGTPYDGISTLVRDFMALMKLMFYVFVQTFKLLWIIALAMITAAGKLADASTNAISWILRVIFRV